MKTQAAQHPATRDELTERLERRYRTIGWRLVDSEPPLLEAVGPHGVKWIGRAVINEDFESEGFEAEILELSERRMPEGNELCPLDLLPAEDCRDQLDELLRRNGLADDPRISVFRIVR